MCRPKPCRNRAHSPCRAVAPVKATESQQGLRYQLAAGDAALAPDLSFLSVETVRVRVATWAAKHLKVSVECIGRGASFFEYIKLWISFFGIGRPELG